ncbi:hypothetical protein GYA49_02065 [Candidatus Beckwithbacteria bacterium]|nr:hypothetical protein [Candidatus Beckwithbacteria bacterium]
MTENPSSKEIFEPLQENNSILFIAGNNQKADLLCLLGVGVVRTTLFPDTFSEADWQAAYEHGPFYEYGYIPEVLAWQKAVAAHHEFPDSHVITSDTLKVIRNNGTVTVLEKPANKEEAVKQIMAQSGKEIIQKGVLVYWDGVNWKIGIVETKMNIAEISEGRAQVYVEEYFDKKLHNIPGSLPIMHEPTRIEFYEDGFEVSMSCATGFEQNRASEPKWQRKSHISLSEDGLNTVFAYINGFAPPLLEEMGLFS